MFYEIDCHNGVHVNQLLELELELCQSTTGTHQGVCMLSLYSAFITSIDQLGTGLIIC